MMGRPKDPIRAKWEARLGYRVVRRFSAARLRQLEACADESAQAVLLGRVTLTKKGTTIFMKPCQKEIILSADGRRSTYCMKPAGHRGKCAAENHKAQDQQPSPHGTPAETRTEKTRGIPPAASQA